MGRRLVCHPTMFKNLDISIELFHFDHRLLRNCLSKKGCWNSSWWVCTRSCQCTSRQAALLYRYEFFFLYLFIIIFFFFFFINNGFALDSSLCQRWQRQSLRWNELTQKEPVYSNFEEVRVVSLWKHRRRQRVPLPCCAHYKRRLETLSANWWNSNKVGMVRCSASGCPMVEGGRWDEVVEFLGTLTEVQSVEDRQAGNLTAMSQAKIGLFKEIKRKVWKVWFLFGRFWKEFLNRTAETNYTIYTYNFFNSVMHPESVDSG